MNKTIFSLVVALLACAAGSAKAADRVSANTLGQMGLSGLTVMSDRDAMAVRGLGFVGLNCNIGTLVSPSATATGNSSASISAPGCANCGVVSNSATQNAYNAVGPHSASGSNYSEAGITFSTSNIVDGVGASLTTTSTKVWAGGNSSAKAF